MISVCATLPVLFMTNKPEKSHKLLLNCHAIVSHVFLSPYITELLLLSYSHTVCLKKCKSYFLNIWCICARWTSGPPTQFTYFHRFLSVTRWHRCNFHYLGRLFVFTHLHKNHSPLYSKQRFNISRTGKVIMYFKELNKILLTKLIKRDLRSGARFISLNLDPLYYYLSQIQILWR